MKIQKGFFGLFSLSAKSYQLKAKKGFTLIELLVVIAIIGLLASVTFAALGTARARGRDARRVSDLREMSKVILLADKDPAPAITGCVGINANVNTCTVDFVGLASYADPSAGAAGTVCPNGANTCQYSISKADGTAAATSQNYRICVYLETGSGTLAKGLVRVTSDGGIVAGCP